MLRYALKEQSMNTLESLAIEPNIYYTVEESAQLLRVSKQAILTLLETGRVRGVMIDNDWRVLGAALLDLTAQGQETEASLVSDWLAASSRSLKEVWDNEEDAIYDQL
jgi:excisionase family DNA binding protein